MAHILVVDDEPAMLQLIRRVLEKDQHFITLLSDTCKVLNMNFSKYDLILLDIMMPGLDGFELCQQIRSRVDCPIIFLTAKIQEADIVRGLGLGADDYITKPFSMVLLGKRITALLRRSGQGVLPDTMTFGEVTVDFSGYSAWDRDGKIELTPREIDLLRLFVEHKGLVLTRNQILDELWGDDNPIFDRTIDTYVKNLRKKCRFDRIITVKGIGYKYEERK